MIRVLVVDDSLVARKWAVQCVQSHPEMTIVGEASEGAQAVKLTRKLSPDVIVMDMAMPLMNGVEATRQIMGKQPTPILIVSVMLTRVPPSGASTWITPVSPTCPPASA